MKIEAATRLKITASYTGTKSKDLVAYLKTLVPSLKLSKPGPGSTIKRPSRLDGRMLATDAHTLASKLLADGWVGKRMSAKLPDSTKIPYVSYLPANTEGFQYFPYVNLFKPGANGMSRIVVEHTTPAAIRESHFLRKLNKPTNRPQPSAQGPGGAYRKAPAGPRRGGSDSGTF